MHFYTMAPSPMLAKYEVDREGVGGALAKKKKKHSNEEEPLKFL